MEVSDVMTTDVVIAHEDTSVADLADILTTHHVSAVPVVDSGRVVGVVSQADLLPRVRSARPPGRPAGRPAPIATTRDGQGGRHLRTGTDEHPGADGRTGCGAGPWPRGRCRSRTSGGSWSPTTPVNCWASCPAPTCFASTRVPTPRSART